MKYIILICITFLLPSMQASAQSEQDVLDYIEKFKGLSMEEQNRVATAIYSLMASDEGIGLYYLV